MRSGKGWVFISAVLLSTSLLQFGCDDGGSSSPFDIALANSISAFRGLGTAEATRACLDTPQPDEQASPCVCASGEILVPPVGSPIVMDNCVDSLAQRNNFDGSLTKAPLATTYEYDLSSFGACQSFLGASAMNCADGSLFTVTCADKRMECNYTGLNGTRCEYDQCAIVP